MALLPVTIATIVLIAVYFAVPMIIYIAIMARFCCDRNLKDEFKHLVDKDEEFSRSMREIHANPDAMQAEEEMKRAMAPPPKVLLSFKDVTYRVPVGRGQEKGILFGVSGMFKPGSLAAIMGPSGCGKSTLLDILAAQKDFGTITGDIRVNGKPRSRLFRRVSAYVLQSDVLYLDLTVRETLFFTCELRLPHIVSTRHKFQIVERVLQSLDLVHIADSRIGDDVTGGISGGQKRRVTVAIELITNPSLIFLDEPTSGLDAYGSLQVVSVLRNLADAGRTVVCTIHQPRSDIFKLFDTLMLMKLGRTMFFGPSSEVLPFFRSAGQEVDESKNVADFIVDLTHDKTVG